MTTQADIIDFASKLTDEANADLAKMFPGSAYDHSKRFEVSFGQKYAKIISYDANGSGGSAWGFIDLANGDILKAAGWAKPARHARGNIHTAAVYGVNYRWTGPAYL